MSDFQLSLVAIGALAIVCVLVYNKLQERAARRDADGVFKSHHADVLLDAAAPAVRREPTLDAPSRARPGETEAATGTLPDARLDYVIELSSPRPAAAASVLEYWAPHERRFAPRAMFAGASAEHAWRRLENRDSASYPMLRAALQLVNRQGVVSEADLIEFRSQVETLAAGIGASIAAAPEMKQAMDTARELDAFCAEHDIQVAFHIVGPPQASFPGSKIAAAAEAAGLHLEDDGRFCLRDDSGQLLYSFGDRAGLRFTLDSLKQASTQALTLVMDVPRAPDMQRTFESMTRFARNLASSLGGSLVDDNGNSLDERALAAIGAQLDAVRKALETRGIRPGGALALRLFS